MDKLLKVLIIGSGKTAGGREHVLVWLAGKSPQVEAVYCFGSNDGMRQEPKYITVDPEPQGVEATIVWAKENEINLVIVGPENPLAEGIVDRFREAGLTIFGPTQAAARLESSKFFAKKIMTTAKVPTARYRSFCHDELTQACNFVRNEYPYFSVVKADGLCAGKGAMVCRDLDQALRAIHRCLVDYEFGPAGEVILVEEFLKPHLKLRRAELSVLALVDIPGNFLMFPAAQDYKPVNDNDEDDNTGGMGSFAPVPWVSEAMMAQIGQKVFAPTINLMKNLGQPFSGVLYAGLMWTEEGPKVVEFNVRFGDPEIQALAMLLKTDLIPVLLAIAQGKSIADIKLEWLPGHAVCLVLVSKGYPGKYEKGLAINGCLSDLDDFKMFHAGTSNGKTNGGRVLNLVQRSVFGLEATAATLPGLAIEVNWGDGQKTGPHFRTDIGLGVPWTID